MESRQLTGKKGERLADWYLKGCGYQILERNFRTRMGEIDIVAQDGDTVVFVEVKARHTRRFGNPKWAVTPKKQEHLSKAALLYLKENGRMQAKARFDVVAIDLGSRPPRIELVKNAFDLAVR